MYSGGPGALIVSVCGLGVVAVVWRGVGECPVIRFGWGVGVRNMG